MNNYYSSNLLDISNRKHLDLINLVSRPIYCFKMKLKNKEIFLTNHEKPVKDGDIIFQNKSGFDIKSMHLNDSGKNSIILEGYFEDSKDKDCKDDEDVIDIDTDFNYGSIALSSISGDGLTKYLKYFIKQVKRDDKKFEIKASSIIYDLDKPLLKTFSRYCRANLGDYDCSLKLGKFSDLTKIESSEFIDNIKEKIQISCKIDDSFKEGFFDQGKIIILDRRIDINLVNNESIHDLKNTYEYEIELHKKNNIIFRNITNISNNKFINKINNQYCLLIANCNKTVEECCFKFSNIDNFRGEPHIPC